MAVNPSFIKPFKAEIVDVKGACNAGHRIGDTFSISCYDTGGLCGFFYHDLFPSLSVVQLGESFPGHRLASSRWNARIEGMPSP